MKTVTVIGERLPGQSATSVFKTQTADSAQVSKTVVDKITFSPQIRRAKVELINGLSEERLAENVTTELSDRKFAIRKAKNDSAFSDKIHNP